jgi:DNA-binding IclR family transcriptional regulator
MLEQKWREARAAGFATNLGEYASDTDCIAVPILGPGQQAGGALSILVGGSRFDGSLRQQLAQTLMASTHALSLRLGATDPERWRTGETTA